MPPEVILSNPRQQSGDLQHNEGIIPRATGAAHEVNVVWARHMQSRDLFGFQHTFMANNDVGQMRLEGRLICHEGNVRQVRPLRVT